MVDKLKEIEVDGIKYVERTNDKIGFNDLKVNMSDEAGVIGIGSLELKGDWQLVKVSIQFLKQAIKILENVTYKGKRESVIMAIATDFPLCIGDVKNGENREFSGVMIAPRVEDK